MTDSEDWEQALAGDGEAFAAIFDRHRDRIFRHSIRLVPNWSDTDDVVAVVFLEAWRKRRNVRFVDGSLLPWLLVVATNASLNVSRGRRRFRNLLDRLPPPPPVPDLAGRFDHGEAAIAFAHLSPAHQQVVALCVLEGYSEAEAARALGVPPGTVKSRLSRATASLRRNYLAVTMSPIQTGGRQ